MSDERYVVYNGPSQTLPEAAVNLMDMALRRVLKQCARKSLDPTDWVVVATNRAREIGWPPSDEVRGGAYRVLSWEQMARVLPPGTDMASLRPTRRMVVIVDLGGKEWVVGATTEAR